MSILVHPAFDGNDAMLLTTAASVAVCRGIKEVLHKETQIKWVNDIYLDGRKICGILTEAISNFEMGKIDSAIVGIGINYRTCRGSPASLRFNGQMRHRSYLEFRAGSFASRRENFCHQRKYGRPFSRYFQLFASFYASGQITQQF